MKTVGALAVAAMLLSVTGAAKAEETARDTAPTVVIASDAAISPEKRALAARVVRLTTVDMEKQLLDYMGNMFSSADSGDEDRAMEVWFEKNAGPMLLPHVRIFMTEVETLYARLLSVEELQAMIAFYDTPMGRSIARKQTQLGLDMSGPFEAMSLNYTQDLMARFCSDNDCSALDETQPSAASKSTRH